MPKYVIFVIFADILLIGVLDVCRRKQQILPELKF
jgi:hypothetical protein